MITDLLIKVQRAKAQVEQAKARVEQTTAAFVDAKMDYDKDAIGYCANRIQEYVILNTDKVERQTINRGIVWILKELLVDLETSSGKSTYQT